MLDSVRLVLGLALKDIKLYVRDKVGLAIAFLLPIALVAVFASVFGSMAGQDDSGALPKQELRIADLDGSDASRKLVTMLNESKLADATTADSEGEPYTRERLFDAVRTGKLTLVVVIEKGFGSKLDAGDIPALEVIRDPSDEVRYQITSQVLFQGLMAAHGSRLGRAMALKGIRTLGDEIRLPGDSVSGAETLAGAFFDYFEKTIDDAEQSSSTEPARAEKNESDGPKFAGMGSMLGFKDTTVGGGQVDQSKRRRIGFVSQSVAGTAVMMLLFGLAACGGTLLEERQGGTLRRLLLTPAPRGAILGGKFVMTFLLGLAQLVVMFAFGAVAFGLPIFDHLPGILLVSVALCAAATSFGVFIATVGRSQKQVEGISTLIILLMSALGGSWFPLSVMPAWMQTAGHFTLNAWAMDGYQDLWWRGLPIREILPEVGVLGGVAVVLCVLSAYFFRKRFTSAESF